jgi:hypothetical protein
MGNVGTCRAEAFEYFIASASICETAAQQLNLADTTATEGDWSTRAYGCYFRLSTDRLYFNSGRAAPTAAFIGDTDRVSVCVTGAPTI